MRFDLAEEIRGRRAELESVEQSLRTVLQL